MKNNVGTSAGVLALLALLIHAFVPSSNEGKSGDQAEDKVATKQVQPSSKAETPERPVPEQGPWLASRQYFHTELPSGFRSECIDYLVPPLGRSTTCSDKNLQELFGLGSAFHADQLTAFIATIPDPLHTRMSLSTDRNLAAIQKGAFEAGWEMATQWLPWTVKPDQSVAENGPEGSYLRREKLPGLVIFRRKFNHPSAANELLFVFVVGETPTAGVNGFQFEAARRCIQRLGGGAKMLVLGPTFSGSLPSLTRLIAADHETNRYEVRAGSVSNSGYARTLLEALEKTKAVSFHGSTLPSASFDAQFRYWAHQQGFDATQIAQLVEEGSAFSVGVVEAGTLNGNPNALITFQYPRDIAQLRDAYSDVAFADPASSASKTPRSLLLTLKDTGNGESSFPIFSTNHSPVSQNVVLEQTVKEIKRQRIRLLSVSATNIFDTLFLANVLSKECPDVRIVLSGADMLFVQQAAQNSLSGLLAISPFPMFPDGFRWENDSLQGITFPDADSIGEYNATLALLGADPKSSITFAPPSRTGDYFSSAWVLVLGRYGWAPLDLLDQVNPSLERRNLSAAKVLNGRQWFNPAGQASPNPVRQEMRIPLSRVSSAWTILCLLTSVLSFGVSGRFLYLRIKPNIRTWSAFCSVDLVRGSPLSRLNHLRYACLAACFSSLAFLNGLVLIPMLSRDWANLPLEILTGAATVFPFLTQFYLLRQMSNDYRAGPEEEHALTRRFVFASLIVRIVLLLLPLASLAFWYRLCFYDRVRGSFFRFRVFSLDFSVSPIWPALFATAGLFVVAAFHLRRLTWASRQRPLLETSTLDRSLWGQLSEINDTLHRVFSGPAISKPGVRRAGAFAIASVAIVVMLIFPQESLRSFEPIAFERILIALFLPLSLLVGAVFARFAFSWHTLRRLLSVLNTLDIARHFRRLPDFDGSGPIWVRDLRMTSLATSVNSAIALHNLSLTDSVPQIKPEDYWKPLSSFLSASNRMQLITQYRSFTRKAAEINQIVSDQVLLPFWKDAKLHFVEAGSGRKDEPQAALAKGAAVGGGSHPLSLSNRETHRATPESYEMASEYVALQFSVFIGYALRHIQNLLLCSVLSFVLLVLALNSFSFQTPEAISRLTLAGLAVGAIVVIRALAQIERNPIISRISGTEEGTLGKDFYLQILTYGALPVLAVMGTQFPSIARLLTFWVQPSVAGLK